LAIASRRSPPEPSAAAAATLDASSAPGALGVPRAGAPTREQRSLFGEILDWMLAPLLLLWPMSLALTWLVAQSIANHPYDRALAETVRAIAQRVNTTGSRISVDLAPALAQLVRTDEIDTVYFQVMGRRGELLAGDRELPLPRSDTIDIGEMHLRDDVVITDEVRVAYLWVQPTAEGLNSPVLVQVAETRGKRSRLATEIIKGVILPQFIILPVAVLLVWLALARGLSPLNVLRQRIRNRASDDLSPIDQRQAPEEVAPLVEEINDLMARQQRSLQTQKRFLADAAHQLKTPLAGLRMQAELAQREIDAGALEPEALKTSLQQMSLSSQRAAHMVNQLLAMARADARGQEARRDTVDLALLATEVVREHVPQALDKRIDLGYEGPGSGEEAAPAGETRVLGHELLLREMLNNLVDNALLYTPSGGTVTVRLVSDPFGQVVVLQVEDSGPGIPSAERELVFQPFYRALGTTVDGSGLGLAIVHEVVQQHGGQILLSDAREAHALQPGEGVGAQFTIRLPTVAAAPGTGTGG
jgi:two-component system sensor histidine kinase TctE